MDLHLFYHDPPVTVHWVQELREKLSIEASIRFGSDHRVLSPESFPVIIHPQLTQTLAVLGYSLKLVVAPEIFAESLSRYLAARRLGDWLLGQLAGFVPSPDLKVVVATGTEVVHESVATITGNNLLPTHSG